MIQQGLAHSTNFVIANRMHYTIAFAFDYIGFGSVAFGWVRLSSVGFGWFYGYFVSASL